VASLLGSVSLGVLRTSSRPVLIVRGGTLPRPVVGDDGGMAHAADAPGTARR